MKSTPLFHIGCLGATLLMGGILAGPAPAATPKAWQWTPAQAAQAVTVANPELFGRDRATIVISRCTGKGAATNGRYVSFQCPASFQFSAIRLGTRAGTVFVKVRRAGTGLPCVSTVSLAAVPADCLATTGVRVVGSRNDARKAVRDLSPQTECAGYGAGFFKCWLGTSEMNDPAATVANVTMLVSGPVVRQLT